MMPAPAIEPTPTLRPQRATGSVRLRVAAEAGASRLKSLYQEGSAQARFPARPATAPLEAVLINTAGGMTGGDGFGWRIEVEPLARCQVITQACEKVYKAQGGEATVQVSLSVGAGARLDWTPQETILFDRARLSRRLDADLAPGASLLIVEAVILGRAAMGETVRHGLMRDRWRVRRSGKLIHAEELRIEGEFEHPLRARAALGGAGAFATLALFDDEAERLVEPLRAVLGASAGVSSWDGKLVCRLTAPSGARLRQALLPAISLLSDGKKPPRVWVN